MRSRAPRRALPTQTTRRRSGPRASAQPSPGRPCASDPRPPTKTASRIWLVGPERQGMAAEVAARARVVAPAAPVRLRAARPEAQRSVAMRPATPGSGARCRCESGVPRPVLPRAPASRHQMLRALWSRAPRAVSSTRCPAFEPAEPFSLPRAAVRFQRAALRRSERWAASRRSEQPVALVESKH
jgi:hypothetical protein